MEHLGTHIQMLTNRISNADDDSIMLPGKEAAAIARSIFAVEILPAAAAALVIREASSDTGGLRFSVSDANALLSDLKQIKTEFEQGMPEWRKSLEIAVDWENEYDIAVLKDYLRKTLKTLKDLHS